MRSGVWENRDFRLVLGGGFVNNVGSLLVGLLITDDNIKLLLNVQAALYVMCGVTTLALVVRPSPKPALDAAA